MLTGGVGYRRIEISGHRQRAPARARRRRRLAYGAGQHHRRGAQAAPRRLRARLAGDEGGRGAQARTCSSCSPTSSRPGTHQLVTTITPRKGAARKLTTNLQRRQVRHAAVRGSVAHDRRHRPATARRQPHGDQERGVPAPGVARARPRHRQARVEPAHRPAGPQADQGCAEGRQGRDGRRRHQRRRQGPQRHGQRPSGRGRHRRGHALPAARAQGPGAARRGHKATVTARVVTTKSQNLKYVIAGKR